MTPLSLNILSSFPNNHIDCIWCIKFHPTKNIFASCGSDKKVLIWEYSPSSKQYEKKSVLDKTHKSIIRSLDWDYSGTYLSCASFDGTISIWKINSTNNQQPLKFSCITVLEPNDSEIKSVSWSVSGSFISCCSRKGNIWIFEKDNEDFDEEEFICKSSFSAHKGDIKMVKFSPKEDILFSLGFDGDIKVWGLDLSGDDFILINTLKGHSGTVWFIEFFKEGEKFFTCSDDKKLILWNIDYSVKINDSKANPYENINLVACFEELHSRPIYNCSLTWDQNYVVTSSSDGCIKIVNIIKEENEKGGKEYKLLLAKTLKDAHEQYNVNFICASKNCNKIVSCGDDCCIKVWEIKEDK